MMKRIGFGFLVLMASLQVTSAALVAKPNFVVIVVEDLGREWVSCYGSEENNTPNIDQLAREGVRFETCYASTQGSVSRVELLTGRYPFRTGWMWHNDVPQWGPPFFDWSKEITFARILKQAGYATAIAGRWGLNDLREHKDALKFHGFDEHCVWPGAEKGEAGDQSPYWNSIVQRNDQRIDSDKNTFVPDVFADFVVDFMKRNREQPFLAYYPMLLAGKPWPSLPANSGRGLNEHDAFQALIGQIDATVGKLLRAVEELKLSRRTIIVLTSGCGSDGTSAKAWGATVKGGKGRLTERGVNVPLIVHGIGQVSGGRVAKELVDFSDIFPTLCELASSRVPGSVQIDGKSFAHYLRGGSARQPREWVLAQYGHDRVIREARYKLYSNGRFYDVLNDPLETQNLTSANVSEIIGVKERLATVLRSLPKDQPLNFPMTRRMIVRRPGD